MVNCFGDSGLSELSAGQRPGPASSMLKSLQSETCQQIDELAIDAAGLYCRACRHYRRQILVLRQAMRDAGDGLSESSKASLSPEARQRILDSLNRE